ncbi:hypothetical protein POTOM_004357 [Populus tomentosa]|uniref:Uncharacterized protein n=1 Tax=Populus tomentosa TaxID=118781 RepID=A0A8X8AJP1_POPTO|nr:hypothetical protein POTOM_004357 [Populus tomentosa]
MILPLKCKLGEVSSKKASSKKSGITSIFLWVGWVGCGGLWVGYLVQGGNVDRLVKSMGSYEACQQFICVSDCEHLRLRTIGYFLLDYVMCLFWKHDYLTQQAEQIKQERKSTQLIILEALDSAETIEWKAFAAILDFICPLFGSGLVPLEILSSAAAVTSRTLFIVYIKESETMAVDNGETMAVDNGEGLGGMPANLSGCTRFLVAQLGRY